MVNSNTIKRGFFNGVRIFADLCKIIIPVYIFVQLLSISGGLKIISKPFEAIMSIFGLPGESSLALILGYFIGPYASFSAIPAMNLRPNQITTLLVMISLCHSLLAETAVVKKMGVSAVASLSVRLVSSFVMGYLTFRILG